ncbi:HofP DNA utilization family protein [Enterobacter wuhouensis]|uniref:HofP DNA utilization family protein n=1 Tax=Enterobacter wuhouensis TaxID=2529381 RepID=UPI002FCEA081
MRNSARYLLVCSALLLTGMRDPFQPPVDTCAIGELAQWHYRGIVEGTLNVGMLQDGQKRWHRLKAQDRFPAGWRVITLNESELVVELGAVCEPKQWTWQREGTSKHENRDSAAAVDMQHPTDRRDETRHADGG